ncbi:hypothetical protein NIES4071_63220 [Calothrix sp. NIES-4071]|nr:hypothetical protein NIES4071_63220 [Calothrix sp. NIES-4071]BAZ60625.1 hypothetical protein NIES4105_63170 [Calothrix sp. NIES-4105]
MALLLGSCSDSKVAQCERFIKQVNEGTALIDKSKGAQVTTSLKLAKELKDVTTKIRDLNLSDEKLKEYQSKFVKTFETLSKNVETAGKALGAAKKAEASTAGRATIQKARGDIDTALKNAADAAAEFDSSVSELNQYCTKPES